MSLATRLARGVLKTSREGRREQQTKTVTGTVTRVEGGTAHVAIDGGADDCPCSMTVGCRAGDRVTVVIADRSATVAGNLTDPATGSRAAEAADRAVAEVLGEVDEIASATGQHFWYDLAGAHVSTRPGDPAGPRNAIWNSLGMLFRRGTDNLLAIVTGSDPGMDVYDGAGNEDGNVIASYRGSGSRIGYADGFNTIVQAGLFAIRHATDRLFSVTSDGLGVGVYMGGSTAPTGVNYTDANVEATLAFLQDGCTMTGGIVYDSHGTDTSFRVSTSGFVKDGAGRSFSSAKYSDIGYLANTSTFYAEPQLSPQSEVPGVPVSIDMANVNVSAANGKMTVTGPTTVKGDIAASNLCEVNASRSLGTGGTARAYRIGSLLVITGVYSGVTMSSTYSWTQICTAYAPGLNIPGNATLTSLGCLVDASGGGPAYAGSVNMGGRVTFSGLQVAVEVQTSAAITNAAYVRFIATARIS